MTTSTSTTETAPTAAVEFIALGRLGVAEENVRRTDRKGGVEGLAESIAAEGLLQNLTGFQTETGRFRIVAGGRRLAALKALAKAGRWSGPVPVRVLASAADAARVSLTENVMRAALHPADEFEAFAALIAEGFDAAEVARRFGTTLRHVEQRMKLAAVSPALLRTYRAGDMTLDQLIAFTVVDDHTRQEQAWNRGSGFCDLSPRGIRMALLSEHVPTSDKLARFVGLTSYEAAGGVVVRDLFSDDQGGAWLAEPELLRWLAAEKMQTEADALSAEGWAWVETFETFPYSGFYTHGRVYSRPIPLSEEDRAELANLTQRRDAALTTLEASPEDEALADELATVEAAIGVLREREWRFTAGDKARAGCAVGLTHEGKVKVERGLIRPEDVRREKKKVRAAEIAASRSTGVGTARAQDPSPALSDTLVEELTAQRTAALRVEVMRRPDLALAGVVHALALPVFYTHAWQVEAAFEIKAASIDLRGRVTDPETCPALKAVEEAHEAWGYRLPGEAGDLWPWLIDQPQDVLLDLLAFLASGSVNAVKQRHEGRRPARIEHADQLAVRAVLDMTAWWTADATFLARLSKPQIAAAVAEGASFEMAAPLTKLAKGEAVQRAAQALESRGWLPEPLRTPVEEAEVSRAEPSAIISVNEVYRPTR